MIIKMATGKKLEIFFTKSIFKKQALVLNASPMLVLKMVMRSILNSPIRFG